jgi:hypothetical protein
MPTDFSKIVYDDRQHSYAINGKPLISATTLINYVVPEFDKETVSQRSAQKRGISQAEILREWEQSGEIARDKGTRLHQYVEDVMAGRFDPVLASVNWRFPEMDAFDEAWKAMRSNLKAKVARQEWTIGDEELGVAGRLDTTLALQPPSLEPFFSVWDWKTGKMDVENRFAFMLPPFQDYEDSKFNRYSVQLSLYRLILERNKPSMKLGDSYILHLRDDGSYHLHRAHDFREILTDWLKDGIPPEIACDPTVDKKLSYAIRTLSGIDAEALSQASQRTVQKLKEAADDLHQKASIRLNSTSNSTPAR